MQSQFDAKMMHHFSEDKLSLEILQFLKGSTHSMQDVNTVHSYSSSTESDAYSEQTSVGMAESCNEEQTESMKPMSDLQISNNVDVQPHVGKMFTATCHATAEPNIYEQPSNKVSNHFQSPGPQGVDRVSIDVDLVKIGRNNLISAEKYGDFHSSLVELDLELGAEHMTLWDTAVMAGSTEEVKLQYLANSTVMLGLSDPTHSQAETHQDGMLNLDDDFHRNSNDVQLGKHQDYIIGPPTTENERKSMYSDMDDTDNGFDYCCEETCNYYA